MNLNLSGLKNIFASSKNADALWEDFSSRLVTRSFKKNDEIKKCSEIEKYINLLQSGSVGLFAKGHNHDFCIELFYEGDFFNDYLSFLTQQSTQLTTIAIEDTDIISITRTDLNELRKNYSLHYPIVLGVAEHLFIKKQQQQIDLLLHTPEERYKKLLNERPYIIKRTPLKFIASYLGITPVSLSRLRKRITTK